MKKRKLKKYVLFNTINTIIILFFVCFYGYRLVYYYLEAHGKKTDEDILLVDELLKHVSMIDKSNGLVEEDDNTYTYKGNSKNNYVKYSGRMFRIIGIDENKNMTLISDNSETIFMPGAVEYKDSYFKEWLNSVEDKKNTGIYLNTLDNPDEYLEKVSSCYDKVNDLENITCEDKDNSEYITLLSLSDYKAIGGANSYLNNKEDYFLVSQNDSNYYWYVAADGGINVGNKVNDEHGVRVVIKLRNSTLTYAGNGAKSNPYIIEKKEVKYLVNSNVSEYVNYSDYTWRIIGKDEEKVKVVLDGYLKTDEEDLTKKYGTTNAYSLTKNTIGYYLNNDFYKSLKDTSLIVKTQFYNGAFSDYTKFNYQNIYNTNLNCYVGLLNYGDLYLTEYPDIFLNTRPYGIDNKIIYTINENQLLYTNYVSSELKIRPVIYLKNANILSGYGSKEMPYVLEVLKDE